jgi:hypothetical protein
MSSVSRYYPDRDNRLVKVTLSGYVTGNGYYDEEEEEDRYAIAVLDITKSKFFEIDPNEIDSTGSIINDETYIYDTLIIQIIGNDKTMYYPGNEINVIIRPKNITSEYELYIKIMSEVTSLINGVGTTMSSGSIYYYNSPYGLQTIGHLTTSLITLVSDGTKFQVKSKHPNYSFSSVS